jgi:uncharacterized protein
MKDVKVIVFGKENVGKSTLIGAIERGALRIDKNNITVAMDYGRAFVNGTKLHFFGTPGQHRFDFMREILSRGANVGVMVLDSTASVSAADGELFAELRQMGIPCLIFVNKTDLGGGAAHTGDIPEDFTGCPVIRGSAKMGIGVSSLVASLASLMTVDSEAVETTF